MLWWYYRFLFLWMSYCTHSATHRGKVHKRKISSLKWSMNRRLESFEYPERSLLLIWIGSGSVFPMNKKGTLWYLDWIAYRRNEILSILHYKLKPIRQPSPWLQSFAWQWMKAANSGMISWSRRICKIKCKSSFTSCDLSKLSLLREFELFQLKGLALVAWEKIFISKFAYLRWDQSTSFQHLLSKRPRK